MAYSLKIDRKLAGKFKKLERKDKKQLDEINRKVEQILENPHHFEHVEEVKHNLHRVHIDNSFVLIYSVDDDKNLVTLHEYDHHDRVYVHPHIDK
jgi:mRNA interferase RelE/StbE/toxin YoeB